MHNEQLAAFLKLTREEGFGSNHMPFNLGLHIILSIFESPALVILLIFKIEAEEAESYMDSTSPSKNASEVARESLIAISYTSADKILDLNFASESEKADDVAVSNGDGDDKFRHGPDYGVSLRYTKLANCELLGHVDAKKVILFSSMLGSGDHFTEDLISFLYNKYYLLGLTLTV
ncbi:uncharacterized protein G2W53_036757 [Senna tora]|uniref:Uncharacterized protein n=1 Tax=Senna tora TaxID=362788 RepID=A0A834T5E5_9FABA|nr:uncharacterized protein G2W53_036757 [Senna tora]